ncbi:MAG: putative Ig domain-containing protein, partial [Pirellulales bacterium]
EVRAKWYEAREAEMLPVDQEVDEGRELTFTISASDADLPANSLSYSAPNLPAGASFDPSTGIFRWTPSDDQGPGSYDVTFAVDDGSLTDAATVTITVSDAGELVPQVRVELVAVDEQGLPISAVAVGQTFVVQAIVEDMRPDPQGVFAAFVDVRFDKSQLVLESPIEFGRDFGNGRNVNTETEGVIDEAGAFGGLNPTGRGSFVLFSASFKSLVAGETTIEVDAADMLPAHAVLLYGRPTALNEGELEFQGWTIEVQEPYPWQNPRNRVDVNDDGFVTPIDALLVINELNSRGVLDAKGKLPFPRSEPYRGNYYDVNGDGFGTPLDALHIINVLNAGAQAEGEFPSLVAAAAPTTRPLRDSVLRPTQKRDQLHERSSVTESRIAERRADQPDGHRAVDERATLFVGPLKTALDELLEEIAADVAGASKADGRNEAVFGQWR